MARVGVIIPVLMLCGLLVSACTSESSAVPKKTSPARVTTETVRIGRLTQVFDTSLPADPAQASVVQEFRTAMILWDKSSENLTLVPPVTAYVTGSALRGLKAALARAQADTVVPGGADRFFKTRAAVNCAAGPRTSSTGTRPGASARSGTTRGCGSRCSSARSTAAAATSGGR